MTTILRFGSGSPISILDPGRGTLNRGGRSGRNTASSTLSKDEIKNLFGDFTRDGVRYFINPDSLDITRNSDGSTTSRPKSTVFFGAGPGQVGNLERAIVNGPSQFRMDAGLAKRIRFTESTSLQLRAEAFNLTNRNNFFIAPAGGTFQNINIQSSSFGQLSPNFSTQAQSLEEPRRLQFAIRFEF
ncbi:MAG: hypothetical protein WKF84_11880 [Pyrinomonadaceae bacterium]